MRKIYFKVDYVGVIKSKLGIKLTLQLELLRWFDDNVYFVYSPVFDLTGYGNSVEEAKTSFEIVLEEYIRYTHNKKTFFDDLEN